MAATKYKKGNDGYYSTRIWDGSYNSNGTKHYKHLRSKKSSKDLENKVRQLEAEVEERRHIRKTDITFFEYAITWFKVYKAQRENNTKAMYRNIVEKHFFALEGIKLRDIERIHLQMLLNNADSKIRIQQQIYMTFKQVLKSAVADHLFPANVMEDIFNSVGHVKYTPKEKRPLSHIERNAVFKADFEEPDKIYAYLLYGCGLRREEALALTVIDINIKDKEVTINKAHEFVNDKPRKKAPKSKNGYRTVPIPDDILPAVSTYVSRLKSSGRTYLFTMRNGQPRTKSSYDKMWNRILRKMQETTTEPIIGLTAHMFRHNYCTNMCYQIPRISIKKIAQLMGDTEAVALKVYNHMILEKEDATGAVNAAMNLEQEWNKNGTLG